MNETNGNADLKLFPTGAVRSTDAEAVDYSAISPIALRALAETCAYGNKKHGLYNAERGMGARDLLNHALKHIYDFLEGKREEEDLAHAMWNVGMAIHSLALWPHLNQDLRREGCIPPNVDDATAASWKRLHANLEAMKADLKKAAGPIAGERLRTMDFVHVGEDGKVYKSTPRHPKRYLVVVPDDTSPDAAMRLTDDFRDAGLVAEVSAAGGSLLNADLHVCDTAVLWQVQGVSGLLDRLRVHGKPLIVIGTCPDDFPRLGTDERWFPTWAAMFQSFEVAVSSR